MTTNTQKILQNVANTGRIGKGVSLSDFKRIVEEQKQEIAVPPPTKNKHKQKPEVTP